MTVDNAHANLQCTVLYIEIYLKITHGDSKKCASAFAGHISQKNFFKLHVMTVNNVNGQLLRARFPRISTCSLFTGQGEQSWIDPLIIENNCSKLSNICITSPASQKPVSLKLISIFTYKGFASSSNMTPFIDLTGSRHCTCAYITVGGVRRRGGKISVDFS